MELLDLRHERDGERIERMVAEHPGILDVLLALCRDNQRSPGLVRLFTILAAESVDADHPAHGWTVARYAGLRARLTERLATDQRAGRVAADLDPGVVATQILAMFDGLQLQWLLAPEHVDMAAVFADFVERLAT